MGKLRIGIIGTGDIADRWHAPALLGLDQACFWSVLSRSQSKAESFASKHSALSPHPAYTNIIDFLQDPDLDAVIIASPDRLHAQQAIMAANAGKHILVEKPLAVDSAAAREIINAAAVNNVKLAVGYHLRFHQAHRELFEVLSRNELGSVRHMRVNWALSGDSSNWRTQNEFGRWWSLAALGTHCLDFVQWMLSAKCGRIVRKSCLIESDEPGGADRSCMLSLIFEQGTTAEIYVSMAYRALSRVEIFAERESAVLTGTFGPRERGHMRIGEREVDYERGSGSERTPLYVFELQDFAQAIVTDREPVVGGAVGLLNVQVLETLFDDREVS